MATAGWQGAIVDYPAIADGTTYCITPSLEELAEWHASADGRRKLKNRNFNLMDLWQPRERPTRLGAGRNQLLTPLFSYGFAPCSNSAPLLVSLCVLFCISSRDPVHDAESLHSLFIAHDLLWTLSTVGDVTARRERQRSRLRISSTLQLLPGDLALAGQSLIG